MPMPNAAEVCRIDLFTAIEELQKKYNDKLVNRVLRVRDMYAWYVAHPDATDVQFVSELLQRHEVSRPMAYSDLAIIKTILPNLASASRDFHRWRYNEMILDTYAKAKKRGDTRTMERCATSYAKNNRVDLEDEKQLPYDMIVVQPFTATDDPRVLGIEPIPNLDDKISSMIEKYRRETIDIEDVSFEDVDLEFDKLFPADDKDLENGIGQEDILQ